MYTRARISNDGKTVGEGVHFERVRRVTGYLVGTLDRFNDGKRAEVGQSEAHAHADQCPKVARNQFDTCGPRVQNFIFNLVSNLYPTTLKA